jgi:hypothetical protein
MQVRVPRTTVLIDWYQGKGVKPAKAGNRHEEIGLAIFETLLSNGPAGPQNTRPACFFITVVKL